MQRRYIMNTMILHDGGLRKMLSFLRKMLSFLRKMLSFYAKCCLFGIFVQKNFMQRDHFFKNTIHCIMQRIEKIRFFQKTFFQKDKIGHF